MGSKKQILVYGYYGKKNLGDDLFQKIIPTLWPKYKFTFVSSIPKDQSPYDALVFGPGDILFNPLEGHKIEERLPVGFLGVGFSPDKIAERWKALLARSSFCVTRDNRASGLYNALQWPDLSFALQPVISPRPKNKQITIFLNENLTPQAGAPEWKLRGWEWFSFEFAQTCDELRKQGWLLDFIPMQISERIDDRLSANAIVSRMAHRTPDVDSTMTTPRPTYEKVIKAICRSQAVITTRLHAAMFATQTGTPFVAVVPHDKMKLYCQDLGYTHKAEFFGARKWEILNALEAALQQDTTPLLAYSKKAYDTWASSGMLMAKLFGNPA